MKFLTILKKDFKLLLRAKSSAFTVFIGPMLIIALILFTFSSSSEELSFSVGVVDAQAEGLALDFTTELINDGYTVLDYKNIDSCIEEMKSSKINLCIDFPEDFEVSGIDSESGEVNKKEVKFYVDQSRLNVVESIMYSVGSSIESKSEEVTQDRIEEILTGIGIELANIKEMQEDSSSLVDSSQSRASSVSNNVGDLGSSASSIEDDLSSANEDISSGSSSVSSLDTSYEALKAQIETLISEAKSVEGASEDLTTAYEEMESILSGDGATVESSIDALESTISSLQGSIGAASSNAGDVASVSGDIEGSIETISVSLSSVENNLDSIKESLAKASTLSGQSVENEFSISVEEIVSSSDKSLFMFPYYLILLMLFVGMILASNLVVIERQSKAFFRNYTSPTSSTLHLVSRFFTNFIILAVQSAVVLASAYYYLGIPVLENYKITALILVLSASLFIFLGYLIGYVFKTQEGITIAQISIGGALAFLSNLVLPVESFSYTLRSILMYNPYMLSSELLKKAILFQSDIISLGPELLLLAGYLVVVVVVVLLYQKFSLVRFSLNIMNSKVLSRPHITEEGNFRLETGEVLDSVSDLDIAVRSMKPSAFELYGIGRKSETAVWVKEFLGEKKLARKIRRAKSRKETLAVLDDFLAAKE